MGNCSCMGDILLDYCERKLIEQDKLIESLEADAAAMQRVINHQRAIIDNKDMSILACQIQAAESEDRADEEKRKRIALLMRI